MWLILVPSTNKTSEGRLCEVLSVTNVMRQVNRKHSNLKTEGIGEHIPCTTGI